MDSEDRFRLKTVKWQGTRAELIALIKAQLRELHVEMRQGSLPFEVEVRDEVPPKTQE